MNLYIKPEVWLVRTISFDRFFVGEPGKRCLNRESQMFFPKFFHKFFMQGIDHLFIHKRHLNIHLRKFRLAICTKVFIPETFYNLEIAVKSRYHKQLLVGLGTLGKCKKAPRIDTTRDQVIPGSLGCGAHQKGRSEEHTSELQSRGHLVCRLLLEKKKKEL